MDVALILAQAHVERERSAQKQAEARKEEAKTGNLKWLVILMIVLFTGLFLLRLTPAPKENGKAVKTKADDRWRLPTPL